MMKAFFFCLLVLITPVAQCQNFDVETIGVIKDKVALSNAVFFNNSIYGVETVAIAKLGWTVTINKMRMGCKIFRYDSTMNLLKEYVLANGDDVYGPFQPFLKVINNRLYLVTYDYNTTDGIIVNISPTDPNTLEVSAPKKILNAAQKNVGAFRIMNLYSSYTLFIKSSPDKSKTLFLWNAGVNNSFSYAVADSSMNILKNGSLEIENTDELVINSLLLDNGGNFYAAYRTNKKNKNLAAILAVDIKGDLKTNIIELGDIEARSACIATSINDSQLRIAGPARSSDIYIGTTYSMLMDKKSLSFSKIITKEIPQELLEKFDADGFAKTKKNKNGLYPEFTFESFSFSDGTVMLAADLTRYQSMGANGLDRQTLKGSTFIVSVTASGDMKFIRLPKREIFGVDTENAFFAHQLKDKAILFYVDTWENVNTPLESGKSASFTSGKNNALVAAIIEKDGSITRRVINPPASNSFYFSPATTSKIDNNTLLLGLGKDRTTLTRIKTNHSFYKMKIVEN